MDVLVLDGQLRQSLAATRSLGRAGLRIGVLTPTSLAARSLAGHSTWAHHALDMPAAESGLRPFKAALLRRIQELRPRVIIPGYDGTIELLRECRPEVERLASIAMASDGALEDSFDKRRTLEIAEGLGIRTPRRAALHGESDVDAAVSEVGLPAVLKPDRSWVTSPDGHAVRVTSELVTSREGAQRAWERQAAAGCRATLQEWLPGRRDAVSLFLMNDEFLARFAQSSRREFPAHGGASAFYESLPLSNDLTGPAERLVRAIGIEGCSMVEFRRDAEGVPVLMEINARMGGSVGLAVKCGVNFPLMAFQWANGERPVPVQSYRIGYRARWLAGDIWNLKACLDQSAGPESPGRLRAVRQFVVDFVTSPSAIEPFQLRDPVPGIVDFRTTVLDFVIPRLRRMGGRLRPGGQATALLLANLLEVVV